MAHYSVSFELKSNDTYSDRYDSLMEAIQASPSKAVWTETTSFALVETTESLTTFANRLYVDTDIDDRWDKLLVIDHLNGNAIARAPIKMPKTLKSHFHSCDVK